MLLLAFAAMGFAFYKVEEERTATNEARARALACEQNIGVRNVAVRGCGCGGSASEPYVEEDFVFVQGRVDPRLRMSLRSGRSARR